MPVILSQGSSLGCQGQYAFTDVMTVVKEYVHQIPVTTVQVYACDQIASMIHVAFPWRWTRAQVTNIALADGQQDYPLVPSDFFRLVGARIARTDISPIRLQPIKITKHIEPELQLKGSVETIQQVSYEPDYIAFRLDRSPSISGTVTYQLRGEYQRLPTKVTNLSQTICPPDLYFNVFVEGVLWKIYQLADDSRAGVAQTDGHGRVTYTGQLGVYMGALDAMKCSEDDDNGMQTRFPEDALGWSRIGSPGLFGY